MLFLEVHAEYKTRIFHEKKTTTKKPTTTNNNCAANCCFWKTHIFFFLFAKYRGDSDLCKPLPNQPKNKLAGKRRALYLPLKEL